ncbi:MAG: hypothetical protein AAGA18_12230 [Verrucomicrobiota bacterium]
MLKGCLLTLAIGLAIIFILLFALWTQKDSILEGVKESVSEAIENMEAAEKGQRELIENQYGEILKVLEDHASESNTLFQFASTIEELPLPNEFIYIAINLSGKTTVVIQEIEWKGLSLSSFNNYGSGTIRTDSGSLKILTYKSRGFYDYMDYFTVYIKQRDVK